MNKLLITVAAAAALLPLSGSQALAATAGQASGDSGDLVYAADPGEANQLTISLAGDKIVLDDSGATITPAGTCAAITAHRVSCDRAFFVRVQLEDGDDTATTTGEGLVDGYLALDGDSGADTLTVGDWRGGLDGGVGADVLT